MTMLALAHPTASPRRRRTADGVGRRSIVEVAAPLLDVPMPDLHRITRIRSAIARGTYDTPWRLRVALDRMIECPRRDAR
jgi:hypothetical protein